jgi:hypothetical protein
MSRWKRLGVATMTASTGVLQERERIRVRPRDTGGLRRFGKGRGIRVAERGDFGVTGKTNAGDVVGHGDLAGADETDSDGHTG